MAAELARFPQQGDEGLSTRWRDGRSASCQMPNRNGPLWINCNPVSIAIVPSWSGPLVAVRVSGSEQTSLSLEQLPGRVPLSAGILLAEGLEVQELEELRAAR